MISRETIVRVQQIPIEEIISEYVTLRRDGERYFGLCPFHSEKTPSFSVTPGKNLFYCFGCHTGGTNISFLEKINGSSFYEAVKELAGKFGVPFITDKNEEDKLTKEGMLIEVYESAADFYHECLLENTDYSKMPLDYLLKRISMQSIQGWKIGLASIRKLHSHLMQKFPEELLVESGIVKRSVHYDKSLYDYFRDRIIIPIRDSRGKIIGFAGRVVNDGDLPKYINTENNSLYQKSDVLFGMDKARMEIVKSKEAIVAEGYFDVIASHEHGIRNVVAPCGTALTDQHINSLERICERIILCMDADDAGIKAADKAARKVIARGVSLGIVNLSDKDPADLLKNNGEAEYKSALQNPMSFIDFAIKTRGIKDIVGTEERYAAVKKLYDVIDASKSPLQRAIWIRRVAETLGLEEKIISDDYALRLRQMKQDRGKQFTKPVEEYVLGLLASNPNHRREARSRFIANDFSRREYGLFFDFISTERDVDDVLIKPHISVEVDTLFSDIQKTDLIKHFKEYCEKINDVIHEEQLSMLIGALMQTANNDPAILDKMEADILKKELTDMDRMISRSNEPVDTRALDAYEEKLKRYLQLQHYLSSTGD